MAELFNDLVEAADTGSKAAIRALQAWQYLIAKAHNRQIIRYDEISQIMNYADNRPLSPILGHIMFYCNQQNLPPLTIIVVNQHGTPGEGFTEKARHEFDRRREEVFSFDWFGIRPPSIEEFQ